MGKKSKKGVSRAGNKKHAGAGKTHKNSGTNSNLRAKSDASRASRDNTSVDGNPDLTRLASESKAPTGPPPKDVVAMVNSLLAAQQKEAAAEVVAASGMSNGASNKENNSASALKSPSAPEAEETIANIGEVDNSPPCAGDVKDSDEELEKATVEVPASLKEKDTAPVPVVDSARLEVSLPVVEPPTPELFAPRELEEPVPVVEPPIMNVISPAVVAEPSKPTALEPESLEKTTTAPETEEAEEPAPQAVIPEVEEVAVAEPKKSAPPNPLPPAVGATTKDATPDVWSQKLRDVVVQEPAKPVLDVTPPPKSTSRGAVPLDMPSPPEVEVKNADCGCLIL